MDGQLHDLVPTSNGREGVQDAADPGIVRLGEIRALKVPVRLPERARKLDAFATFREKKNKRGLYTALVRLRNNNKAGKQQG